jgi:hypothetical protein
VSSRVCTDPLFCVTCIMFYSAGVSIRVGRRAPGRRAPGRCRASIADSPWAGKSLTPEKLG